MDKQQKAPVISVEISISENISTPTLRQARLEEILKKVKQKQALRELTRLSEETEGGYF